ncbi:2,3-diaminopropionate biosynthesis protein SbnA [Lentzea sp. NBRC 105346]|uniref:2,3-diaminopropionate biosynthesis protein SbnA n=1 Tax=Lentzea sp. NBRC 105346 TaxID=3032205 RepID=UPI00249FA687|nr:2,3-diaminopropionate biosynthesis protein SbnA [Lentzea sp. NBRC 105346]GLZ29101.1 2,3-diaminopropionate biosynthesis protein SbnA [Lentzea sp. NBRC 105346]
MPVISAPQEFNVDDLFVDLHDVLGRRLYLKCEGFNFAGSIKVKAAAEMLKAAEMTGEIGPDTTLIESSSGNLGIALSMIAANRGYRFVCVTDARANEQSVKLMRAYGAQVDVITEPCPRGGFLGARLDHVRNLCALDDTHVWLNQYASPDNWGAHYRTTGPEIIKQFPDLDVLFVGAGTTGTLMGVSRYIRDEGLPVTIVAIDTEGSTTFGTPAGKRMIPGLGTSVRPPMLDESYVDDVVWASERDAIRMCHKLSRKGFLFGGSTGSVLAGAFSWLDAHDYPEHSTAVLISPDLGERYLGSVYDQNWVSENYGPIGQTVRSF